jgi:hypothetical protein
MKTLLSSSFLFFFGLIILEICLRIINSDMKNYDIEMWKYAKELKTSHPDLGHIHKANSSAILQNVQIKLNSLGMRSEQIQEDKEKIVFLGASLTLGWGVNYHEAYPTIIGENLSKDFPNYQVLNSSTGNYNSYCYINNFLQNQGHLKPKYIVINYYVNDTELLPDSSKNWFMKNSQLVATLYITIKKMLSQKDAGLIDYYNNLHEESNVGYQLMIESMSQLSDYSKKNDVKVIFVFIPEVHFLDNYPFLNINQKMKKVAIEFGFDFFDLYDTLKGIKFEDIKIMDGDAHPNAFIHSLIAKDLNTYLENHIK